MNELTREEAEFLSYALDLAANAMATEGGFTKGDYAALGKFRSTNIQWVEPEPALCGGCGEPKNNGQPHGYNEGYGGCV